MRRLLPLILLLPIAATVVFLFRAHPSPTAPPAVAARNPAPRRPSKPSLAAPSLGDPGRPAEESRSDLEESAPFRFDDAVPLRTQVRDLLRSIHVPGRGVIAACRERRDEVVPELLAVLRDPSTGYNVCEQALAFLEYLEATDAVPAILEIAWSHANAHTRADAVRTLGAFPKTVRAGELRALFDSAKTEDERYNCVQALGEVGDAGSLPFLEELARRFPDSLMIQFADEAAAKVRLQNSPRKEVELVQLIHDVEHPLRDWALKRIVEEKRSGLAPQLRHALDTHRKLPKSLVDGSFEFSLLVALRDFGQPLSPGEQAFVARYSVQNDAPLPDE